MTESGGRPQEQDDTADKRPPEHLRQPEVDVHERNPDPTARPGSTEAAAEDKLWSPAPA